MADDDDNDDYEDQCYHHEVDYDRKCSGRQALMADDDIDDVALDGKIPWGSFLFSYKRKHQQLKWCRSDPSSFPHIFCDQILRNFFPHFLPIHLRFDQPWTEWGDIASSKPFPRWLSWCVVDGGLEEKFPDNHQTFFDKLRPTHGQTDRWFFDILFISRAGSSWAAHHSRW